MRVALVALSLLVIALAGDGERERELVARLGAREAAAREQAQAELERLGTEPEGALREALKTTEDPEAKTRIEGLLQAIKAERGAFQAIPPERLAELSPLIHAFHAEWSGHLAEWDPPPEERTGCGCEFRSLRAAVRVGGPADGVLRRMIVRLKDLQTGEGRGGFGEAAFLRALIPPTSSTDVPGLDELGPLYADLVTDDDERPFTRDELLRALSEQRSLGAGTALVAWVHSTRAALQGELTGGCVGNAAPLYNQLTSVQRALGERGDRRLVPLLVELLDEEDQSREFAHIEGPFTVPSPTHLAIEVLRKLTAEELPYDGLSADRANRAQAIASWRDWYEKHKAEFVR